MRYAAALSRNPDSHRAVDEIAEQLHSFGPASLAAIFFSPHHARHASDIVHQLHTKLNPAAAIGSVGEAIIGTGVEIESAPALSVWLAAFDDRVAVHSFHLEPMDTPDGLSLLGWPDALDAADPAKSALLIIGDPYTFPLAELFFPRVQDEYPGLPVFGGMASGSRGPGQTPLVTNNSVETVGAVGVLLEGPAISGTVVSQGCRPIGAPQVVTKGNENIIQELGGQPALQYLQDLFPTLSQADQYLVQSALHVGIAGSEHATGRGDFLVRNLTGIDRISGAIQISDRIRVGQHVQFQVRDAATANEDLRSLLSGQAASAALLFTCNGRGTRFFHSPNHDAGAIREVLGDIPVAGFFAAGELGPVGGVNHIHGFTASAVLFR